MSAEIIVEVYSNVSMNLEARVYTFILLLYVTALPIRLEL